MVSERDIAFPILTGAQIATLEARGRRRAVKAGDVLFTEGDRGYSFFVVIAGLHRATAAAGPQGRDLRTRQNRKRDVPFAHHDRLHDATRVRALVRL